MSDMDKARRRALKDQYKQMKIYMGVFRITNTKNGKIYVGSCPDLKNKWLTLKMQLDENKFANPELQRDWNALGEAAFSYDVLEEQETDDIVNMQHALKTILAPHLELLQPYGEKGYNRPPKT